MQKSAIFGKFRSFSAYFRGKIEVDENCIFFSKFLRKFCVDKKYVNKTQQKLVNFM